jgi:hypothetical protein
MVDKLDELVLGALRPDERSAAVAYVDGRAHPPGPLEIGELKTELERDAYVAFVDRAPGANWLHPARYLLVDAETGAVRDFAASRPPVFGPLPSTWRVVARGPEVEDWQLLPINPTD